MPCVPGCSLEFCRPTQKQTGFCLDHSRPQTGTRQQPASETDEEGTIISQNNVCCLNLYDILTKHLFSERTAVS